MARWMGIDVTATAIRVALIRSTYRRTTVEALREVRRADHETPSAALRAATAGLRCDSVATGLSGERVFLRLVSLPAAAQKELESVLGFEVESTLPFEMDDGIMDHRLLTHIKGVDSTAQIPILAGVAYTEEVRDRIGLILRGTGHEPLRIGVGSLPYVNLAQVAPEIAAAEATAIIDIDDTTIDVLILRRGEPRFVRSLSRGSMGFPDSAGLVSRELRQSFGAWRVQGGPPIETVYVVGAGRQTQGLDGFLQSQVGVTVRDLPKLALEGVTPEQVTRLPRFAKALSLALSLSRRSPDLNLRQGPLEAQQNFQFVREKVPLLAGLFAAIFVSFGFSVFAELRALDVERETLGKQLEVASETRLGKKTRDPKAAQQMLDDAVKGKTDDPLPPMDGFDFMVELSKAVPKEITHDIADFDVNREKVTIKGIVDTIDHAEIVKDNLSKHECFKDVNRTHTTRLDKQEKQKYTLELEIDCTKGADKPAAKPGAKPGPKPKSAPKGGK